MQASANVSHGQSARQLFVDFLEDYLEIQFVGFQSRFGLGCDLILFRAPSSGSTLAIDCDILLQPRSKALETIQLKIAESDRNFLTPEVRV